jgi:hypothetical protein
MDLKHGILTLVTSVALIVPAAAFADHDDDRKEWREHRHTSSCHHPPMPAPPPGRVQPGRYEIRIVQNWVAGQWARDWVPQSCVNKRHGRVKCRGGYYVDRWVPGHYEQVEKWVWAPYPPRPGWQVSIR